MHRPRPWAAICQTCGACQANLRTRALARVWGEYHARQAFPTARGGRAVAPAYRHTSRIWRAIWTAQR